MRSRLFICLFCLVLVFSSGVFSNSVHADVVSTQFQAQFRYDDTSPWMGDGGTIPSGQTVQTRVTFTPNYIFKPNHYYNIKIRLTYPNASWSLTNSTFLQSNSWNANAVNYTARLRKVTDHSCDILFEGVKSSVEIDKARITCDTRFNALVESVELITFHVGVESFEIYDVTTDYVSADTNEKVGGILGVITNIFNNLPNWIKTPIEAVGNLVTQFKEAVSSSFSTLFSNLTTHFTNLVNSISQFFSNLITNLTTWFSNLFQHILDLPDRFKEMLKSLIVPTSDDLEDFASNFDDSLSDHFGFLYQGFDFVTDCFSVLWNGGTRQDGISVPLVMVPVSNNVNFLIGGWFVNLDNDRLSILFTSLRLLIDIIATLSLINLISHLFISLFAPEREAASILYDIKMIEEERSN